MVTGTIALWALNLTITKYVLTHGLQPLAYSTVRYAAAAAIFVLIVLLTDRTFPIKRRDLSWVALAALGVCLNQYAVVYAVDAVPASTVGLILGSTPVFAAVIGLFFALESVSSRFWLGALASFAGVALVAVGGGDAISGNLRGNLLGVATAATWALYSIAVVPLMKSYTASQISAIVLPIGWIGILVGGAGQTLDQDYSLGWEVWSLVVFATLGPLVLTNVLWFRALHQIGASRATLAGNMQPFLAAVFAAILLAETIAPLQILGGVLIGIGVLAARSRRTAPAPGAE